MCLAALRALSLPLSLLTPRILVHRSLLDKPQPQRANDARLLELVSAYETNRQQANDEIGALRADIRQLNDSLREKENVILRCGYGVGSSDLPPSAGSAGHPVAMQQLSDRYRELGRLLHAHKVREVQYQKQAKATNAELDSMREQLEAQSSEVENVRLELGSRPSLKMWNASKTRIKQLEEKLSEAMQRARDATDMQDLRKHMSTKALMELDKDNHRLQLYRIDQLSHEVMKEALRSACRALQITDVSLIAPSITKMTHVVSMLPRLERFARQVCDAVMKPLGGVDEEDGSSLSEDAPRRVMEDVLPILQNWKESQRQVKRLQLLRDKSVQCLAGRHMETAPSESGVSAASLSAATMTDDELLASIRDVVNLEQALLTKSKAFEAAEAALEANPDVLVSRIALHFQYLFRVKRLEG